MKKAKSKTIRLLCVLMAVVMVVAVAPTVALADTGIGGNPAERLEPRIYNGVFYPGYPGINEFSYVSISNAVSFERINIATYYIDWANETITFAQWGLTEFEQYFHDRLMEEDLPGSVPFHLQLSFVNSIRVRVNAPAEMMVRHNLGTFYRYLSSNPSSPLVTDVNIVTETFEWGDLTELVAGSSFAVPANAQVGDTFAVLLAVHPSDAPFVPLFIEVVGGGTTTPQPTPAATPSTWAVAYVQRANDLNLVPANLNNSFTQATTRAEFAALAVTLYETVTGRTITERSTFNDTTDINVQKMGGLGVVTGVGGGNFNPNGTITREQAAVLVARLAEAIGQPLPPSAPTFADNNLISSWAVYGVGQMQASGIMGGVGNNNFAPRGQYTREQSIISLLRLFDIVN